MADTDRVTITMSRKAAARLVAYIDNVSESLDDWIEDASNMDTPEFKEECVRHETLLAIAGACDKGGGELDDLEIETAALADWDEEETDPVE